MYLHLYSEPAAPALKMMELARHVEGILPVFTQDVRGGFIATHLSSLSEGARQEALSRLSREFAQARVKNPSRHERNPHPLPGEVDYERRRLTGLAARAAGILYDGEDMLSILHSLIPREEASLSHIHIAFTNQLFGTWESDDRRYHARVSLYGFPSLLSTTGIVEAPAKPREYYFLRQRYASLGLYDAAALELEKHLRGRFIDYNDERLTEVMKGYVMQAIFYHLTGDPFCPDRDCRLFNAHWQEEAIRAQLDGSYEFCPLHQEKLRQLKTEMMP